MCVYVCVYVCVSDFCATHRQDNECSAAWRLACTGHGTCAQQVRECMCVCVCVCVRVCFVQRIDRITNAVQPGVWPVLVTKRVHSRYVSVCCVWMGFLCNAKLKT